MKNRIAGIFFAIILGICNLSICVYAKETPDELKDLYARSAVLMDADSGRILFGKNEEEILPMASTTKIMTCILALENMEENQIGIVSEYAVSQPKVHLGVRENEKYYIEDLLYSLMLESHNDSAVIIAEAIAGTVEKFAKMMNQKAFQIGCTDTYFITPNGLDAQNENGIHSTTSQDLALIMRYCIQISPRKDKFLEITRTPSHQFSDISGKRIFHCNNHNSFLGMMEGALSGKTGFTNNAGYCYVGALRQGKRTFIVAVLACGWPNNKGYKWKDTRKLMEYGLDKYEYQNVWKETKTKKIEVRNSMNPENPFYTVNYIKTKAVPEFNEIDILLKSDEKVQIKTIQMETMDAPVCKNEKIGKIFYVLDGKVIYSYEIVTETGISKRDIRSCLLLLIDRLLLLC